MAAPPPAAQPAPPPAYPQRYADLVRRLELDQTRAADLYFMLSTCEIVLLCDDSGSMQTFIQPEWGQPAPPVPVSRWDELKRLAATLIDFVISINPHGLDVAFLNRPGLATVTEKAGLQPLFANPPSGGTPLCGAIQRIVDVKRGQLGQRLLSGERHLLLIVATDGEPSDGSASQLFRTIANCVSPTVHISAVECTDQEETMDYMDNWNTQLATFDNTDDYRADVRKVKARMGQQAATSASLALRLSFPLAVSTWCSPPCAAALLSSLLTPGNNYKFTYEDWVVKILLGAFLTKYKRLDMNSIQCCTIL